MIEWLVYICLIFGLILIAYSIFGFRSKHSGKNDSFDMEKMILEMDKTINEADNTASELMKISQDVVSEIDDKYQQLLYLYSLIEEKASSLGGAKAIDLTIEDDMVAEHSTEQAKAKVKRSGLNPNLITEKYRAVFDLYNKGLSIPDIARNLNIGQGEVKIVLELGKER